MNRSQNTGEQFALSLALSMRCFPKLEMDQQVVAKVLRGMLSREVETLSGRNRRYCFSGQSRKSVDLLA